MLSTHIRVQLPISQEADQIKGYRSLTQRPQCIRNALTHIRVQLPISQEADQIKGYRSLTQRPQCIRNASTHIRVQLPISQEADQIRGYRSLTQRPQCSRNAPTHIPVQLLISQEADQIRGYHALTQRPQRSRNAPTHIPVQLPISQEADQVPLTSLPPISARTSAICSCVKEYLCVRMCKAGEISLPLVAWFPDGWAGSQTASSQQEVCPEDIFLQLCYVTSPKQTLEEQACVSDTSSIEQENFFPPRITTMFQQPFQLLMAIDILGYKVLL